MNLKYEEKYLSFFWKYTTVNLFKFYLETHFVKEYMGKLIYDFKQDITTFGM